MMHEDPEYIAVDLFCGGGGVTTGLDEAKTEDGRRIVKIIAAVNHDPIAIKSHWANHPEIAKKDWWIELRKREATATPQEKSDFDEIDQEESAEDEERDWINWGDAFSDQYIKWFRK